MKCLKFSMRCFILSVNIFHQFSVFWNSNTVTLSFRRKGSLQDEIVVTPTLSGVGLKTKQLTEENADFASRHRHHQSSFIGSNKMVQLPRWIYECFQLYLMLSFRPHSEQTFYLKETFSDSDRFLRCLVGLSFMPKVFVCAREWERYLWPGSSWRFSCMKVNWI